MNELLDESIDLIIAGPPYWEYINYDSYAKGKEYLWTGKKSYQDFLEDLKKWFSECFRVLKSGRYCIVSLGNLRKKGKCYPIPFHALPLFEEIGFEFFFEIIWYKISGGGRQARGIIKHPYPGYFIPNNHVEYLLIFKKSASTPFLEDKDQLKTQENQIKIDDFFKKEIANNVWHIMPAKSSKVQNHPCPFPSEIPLRLIQLFSLKNEVVLDPFMGIGTTARAAKRLGRKFVGYETQNEFVKVAKKLIRKSK
jgi:modification methylase